MPYINIRLGKRIDAEQRDELYQKMTSLMAVVMKKERKVTVVNIIETMPQQWSVNGGSLFEDEPICVFVDIKITKGTNTNDEKSEMIMKTIKMLKKNIGATKEACYVVIDEIPSENWGYDGITQEIRKQIT